MTAEIDIEELLRRMTLEEKCAQLGGAWFSSLVDGDELDDEKVGDALADGIGQITRIAGESGRGAAANAEWQNRLQRFLRDETRLGIPALVHEEALAGLCGADATQFPQAIGLAATWDPELVEDVGASIGRHLRAVGARLALAPVVDIARDPRWGRLEETYGEDPELTSRIAVAYVRGVQAQGVDCCAKHFIGYAASAGGLNHAEVPIGPRRLRDVDAAPFRALVNEAAVGSVMNAYNEVDGLPCAGSPQILTELLRGELGFEGPVVADYDAVSLLESYHHVADSREACARMALEAGIDIELPAYDCYRTLADQARAGIVDEELVDDACRRVLAQKARLGLFDDPYMSAETAPAQYDTDADRVLARRAAARSIVLLANDGTLPLAPGTRVAVLGPTADDPRLLLGDYSFPAHQQIDATWASSSDAGGDGFGGLAPTLGARSGELTQVATVTPRAALAERFSIVDDIADADVAVVCVGGRSGLSVVDTSGEFRDASDLRLPEAQRRLIEGTAASGVPTVVVVIGGRAHSLSEVVPQAAALVMAWLPGEEGGAGLADVLSGATDAGGRLPVSLLRRVGQVGVHSGHHHGGGRSQPYRDYLDSSVRPLFPFGHGLSYTSWEYGELGVRAGSTSDDVTVDVPVTNTGDRPGEQVVQLYVTDEVASVGLPARRLAAFRRIAVRPGQTVTLRFTVPAGRLGFHGVDLRYRVEPGTFRFRVADKRATVEVTGEVAYPDLNAVAPARSELHPDRATAAADRGGSDG